MIIGLRLEFDKNENLEHFIEEERKAHAKTEKENTKNDLGRISSSNNSSRVAKLSLPIFVLFSCFSIYVDFIELTHLNDLLEGIVFLFQPIRGQEICNTARRQTQAHREPRLQLI